MISISNQNDRTILILGYALASVSVLARIDFYNPPPQQMLFKQTVQPHPVLKKMLVAKRVVSFKNGLVLLYPK